jgi:hypothetical protein
VVTAVVELYPRVEQGDNEAWCYGAQGPYYATWWEEYPTNAIQQVGTTVKAGDKITVSVVRSGTTFTVKVTDSTYPANSFTCASTTCPNSSAEWIAEAPTNLSTGTLYPLAKFTTWKNNSGGGHSDQDREHQDVPRRRDHHGRQHRRQSPAGDAELHRDKLQRNVEELLIRPPPSCDRHRRRPTRRSPRFGTTIR